MTKTARRNPRRPIPMTPETDLAHSGYAQPRKPRLSYLVATSLGLGYLRPGPGTWGSLAGVALAASFAIRNDWIVFGSWRLSSEMAGRLLFVLVSFAGVWAASRVAKHCGKTDPQFVVIDEVSGQWMTLLLGSAHAFWNHSSGASTSYFGVHFDWRGPPQLEIFVAGLYTFSRLRYLEAVSGSSSGVAAGGLGNHGGRLACRRLRRGGTLDRALRWASDESRFPSSPAGLRRAACFRILPTPLQHQS